MVFCSGISGSNEQWIENRERVAEMYRCRSFVAPLLLVVLLFVAAGPAYSRHPAGPQVSLPASLQSGIQQTLASKPGDLFVVLNNGMTVLTRSRNDSDIVSVQVFVRAGSIYEGRYLGAGLSHYLEHVVSGGSTRSFTEDEARERLKTMGGSTNAYTSYDRTVYYITTSAAHWRDALDLLLAYVSENSLDPKETSREKAVIQQEIKMGENNPQNELWRLFARTAYRVHPVRLPVIGYEEVFVRKDRDALLDYYSQRYQPGNIVVSVAGNVDPVDVVQFVAGRTKDFERGAGEALVLPSEPLQVSPRWSEKEHPIARLHYAIVGFPSVRLDSRDVHALDVLSFLLGEGETSRLYRRLKDEKNVVLSVSSSNWTPAFVHGQFMISLTLSPDHWPAVLQDIRDEIQIFQKEPAAPGELDKAKKTAIAQHVFSQETASAVASSTGSSFFSTGDPYFEEAYVEGIRKVTAEDVLRVAREYLTADRMNVAVIKPPATVQHPGPEPAAPSAPSLDSTIELHKLENGLKVLLKHDDSLPLVTLHLYGPGGLFLEQSRLQGISSFTASLLTAGTTRRTRSEILRTIQDVGGSLEAQSDNNTYHVSIKVLKEDLPIALDILSDIVQNSQFPAEEIEKRRQDTLLAIQRMDENWQVEVLRLFKRNYFENSPYRNDRLGSAESVKSLSREDILAFYRTMVHPAHSVLAVFGDLDTAETFEAVRRHFGSWKTPEAPLPRLKDETRQISSNRVVEVKNEKTSAALFVGTNGRSLESSKRPVLDLLNTLLSGAGITGGRLFESLRGGTEDLVYVVGSFPFYGRNAGFFGVITQTTMANLERVETVILDQLRRIQDEPVAPDELDRAKDMLITARKLGSESIDSRARMAALNEALGLGWDYDRQYEGLVRAITPEEIQELARKLFAHTLIVRTLPEKPSELLPGPPSPGGHVHAP